MAPDTEHPFDVAPRKAPGPGAVALMAGLVSGGAVAAFSGDWACAALGSGFVAAAVCGFTAYVLGWRAGQRRRRIAAALAVLVIVIAVAQVLWTKATLQRNAFRTAFGTDPPATVEALRVQRHYAGGPGDTVTLMRFKAGSDVVPKLVAGIPASGETELRLEDFRAGVSPARELWRHCFGLADQWAGGWWPVDAPALKDPLMYARPARQSQMPATSTTILWDRGTGDVYVLITVG